MILYNHIPARLQTVNGVQSWTPAYESAVGPSGDPETEALRGTGSGPDFIPNPLGWRQNAVAGGFTVFIRPVVAEQKEAA